MIAEISVPINDFIDNESSLSYRNSSSGTDFTYIQRYGELMKVRLDQLWFWTDEWQDGEKEVDNLISMGEFEEFDSLDEMFIALHEPKK